MFKAFKFLIACLFSAGLALAPVGVASAQTEPVLLTVTGNVSKPTRGGFDEQVDKFFGYTEVDFSKAAQFDYAALAALGLVTVSADFPKGRMVHEFTGPRLVDVLAAAGASGETVTIQALDGYAVEVPLDQLAASGAVLALKRDGRPFAIGDFGPSQIVFPRAERDDLKDMPDDNWVWSVFHIRIE